MSPVAVKEALPPEIRAPVWVMAPPLTRSRVPVAVPPARTSAVLSVIATLAPLKATLPLKLLLVLLSRIFPGVLTTALPVMVRAPVWVIAPVLARVSVPVAVLAARAKGVPSFSDTLTPLNATVPPKLLPALARVMSPVAVSVALPPAVRVPVWVRAPLLVRARVPVAVEAARLKGVLSVMPTLAPVKATVPVKVLALFRVMSVPVKAALPPTASTPVCVMAAVLVSVAAPEAVLAARAKAVLSNRATVAPVKAMVPPKLLPVLARVMSVAVSVALLPIVRAPFWVRPAAEVTTRVPVVVLAPSSVARLLVSDTLLPVKVTAPVRLLAAFARVMSAPVAVTVVVPATVRAPVWVTAPPVSRVRALETVAWVMDRALASLTPKFVPVMSRVLKSLATWFRTTTPEAVRAVAPGMIHFPVWLTVVAPVMVKFAAARELATNVPLRASVVLAPEETAPLLVMEGALTVKVPDAVEAARISSVELVSETLAPVNCI